MKALLLSYKLTLFKYLINSKLWIGAFTVQLLSIVPFIQKYVFSDLSFLIFLVIAMILDLVTGIAKAFVLKKAVTSKGLRGTVLKCIQYGAFLIITHVLTHYDIAGKAVFQLPWLEKVAFDFLLLIEVKSVYENIIAMDPKLDLFEKVFKKLQEILKNSSSK